MAKQNTHRGSGGMGSMTGFVLALAMLAATAFVFMRTHPADNTLVWTESTVDEPVVAASMD